MVHSTMRASS